MSKRTDKIADLEEKLAAIELYYQDIKKKREALEQELAAVKRIPEPGSRLHVQETCRRGCCIEIDFEGVFTHVNLQGFLVIKLDDGSLRTAHYSDVVKE